MRPLDIWFERVDTPQTFAHLRSHDGLLGHAQEIRDRVPVGTWLNIQPALQPTVTTWLTTKCGFAFRGCLMVGNELHDVLEKVND